MITILRILLFVTILAVRMTFATKCKDWPRVISGWNGNTTINAFTASPDHDIFIAGGNSLDTAYGSVNGSVSPFLV